MEGTFATAGRDGEGSAGQARVSGVVTSYNEEHNIAACIESMLWCDEIVLVDSFSTDRTAEIARGYDKVRFFQRPYYGAGAQKNWALRHVRNDWVFLLDADERCTPELRDEILAVLAGNPDHLAYTINRRVFFLGRRIRFSGWQHDRVARLFKRDSAYYENRRVHSLLRTTGVAPLLRSPIDHHMVDQSFDEYAFRIAKYGLWGAAQAWRDGRRPGVVEVLWRPTWRFLRTYLLQLGILDGARGLVFCLLQSYGTYMKSAILWGWKTNQLRGMAPTLPQFDEDQETWSGLSRIQGGEGEEPASSSESLEA
jgi:glycosyltransferase involved in cell wall biosynthesis